MRSTSAPRQGRKPPADWSPDVSKDNLKSVLMFHRQTRMVFTGDNVGHKILPFVTSCLGAGERVSVFKVPHHGSSRNSQRAHAAASIKLPVRQQLGLLWVLAAPTLWDEIELPESLRSDGVMQAFAARLSELCDEEEVDVDELREKLTDAFRQTISALDSGKPAPWHLVGEFAIGSLWKAPTRGTRKLVSAFNAHSTEVLLSRIAFRELQEFFGRFPASNYVISADGTFRHPAAETIAAIAVVANEAAADASAAHQPVHEVRVFVTDAKSVQLDRIGELAPAWADHLDIRYLARGSRIVLDVTNPANASDRALLDPLNTSDSLRSTITFSRSALRAQFQNNNGATIPGRTLRDDRFVVRVQDEELISISGRRARSR